MDSLAEARNHLLALPVPPTLTEARNYLLTRPPTLKNASDYLSEKRRSLEHYESELRRLLSSCERLRLFQIYFPAEADEFMPSLYRESRCDIEEKFRELIDQHHFPIYSTDVSWLDDDSAGWDDIPLAMYFQDPYELPLDQVDPLQRLLLLLTDNDVEQMDEEAAELGVGVGQFSNVLIGDIEAISAASSGPLRHVAIAYMCAHRRTGNIFLDMRTHDMGYTDYEWCENDIDHLTDEWNAAKPVIDCYWELDEYLKADYPRHARQIVRMFRWARQADERAERDRLNLVKEEQIPLFTHAQLFEENQYDRQ